jgi:hypothetical protein
VTAARPYSPRMSTARRLEVARGDLGRTRWRTVDAPALTAGAVRCRVERLALTANTVTYGAFGDALGYWRFFPTDDPAWGLVPAWGFATVEASEAPGIEPGSRWWGYWPMADRATLVAGAVSAHAFVDAAPHRRELPAVYNRYVRAPAGDAARDDRTALFRPLFTTSFLIDDFLAEHGGFGASQVLLSSASSKTAWGLAWCLAQRGVRTVGLTSAGNVAFVRGLGVYGTVVAYDALASLDGAVPTVFVDLRGSAASRAEVHGRWRERLVHSASVGAADWTAVGPGGDLPGPRPVLFFAPAQAERRLAAWGPAEFERRLAAASDGFLAHVATAAGGGAPLRAVHVAGEDAIGSTWHDLVAGRVPPDEGRIALFAAAVGRATAVPGDAA